MAILGIENNVYLISLRVTPAKLKLPRNLLISDHHFLLLLFLYAQISRVDAIIMPVDEYSLKKRGV